MGETAVRPLFSRFTSDPANPVVDPYASFGPRDYQALAGRDDVLVFDSAPLTEDLVVAGAIEAVIHAACDCRDFDLWVRLLDVYPDGRAINVMGPGNDITERKAFIGVAGARIARPFGRRGIARNARSYKMKLKTRNPTVEIAAPISA